MTYVNEDKELSLWNENDGFYYDAIQWNNGHSQQIPVRSLVGLMPLYATAILEPHVLKKFPSFRKVSSPTRVPADFSALTGSLRTAPTLHIATSRQ